jgi:methylmalonyl-CoA/ethylmalonyl-CoA epimerase
MKPVEKLPHGLRLNHIGLVVEDIEAAAQALSLLGLKKRTLPEEDHAQKVNATFIEVVPDQDVHIELLEPTAEDSPISGYLKKGGGLHHLCFEVSDMDAACTGLERDGFRCITEPTYCRGFDRSFGLEGTRIAFFMTPIRLLVELVDKNRIKASLTSNNSHNKNS